MKCLYCGKDSGYKYFCSIQHEVLYCDEQNEKTVASTISTKEDIKIANN